MKMKNTLILIALSLLAFSCREENYELKIRSEANLLIVDARVESSTKKVKVNLTKSTEFLGNNPVNYINDALVFIKVDEEDEQMLIFLEDGNYELENIKVDEGTNYQLRIVDGEDEYFSTTKMLNIIPVNSFVFEEAFSFGTTTNKRYNFNMILNIDLKNTNYYLTETSVYDTSRNEFRTSRYQEWDDGAYNSNPALFPFFVNDYLEGDSLYIQFSHISEQTFQFYESLGEVGGQNPSSLAPANPTSNLSNGAIGTFGAYATFEKYLVVKP